MDILIAMTIGAVIGFVFSLFIVGASRLNREQDIYMEGFIDGEKAERIKHEV